VRLKKYLFLMR